MAKHIKDICFFQDYGLWAKAGMQARIGKTNIAGFIAECVEQRTGQTINYTEELFAISEKEAQELGCTIAQYMELCCSSVVEPKKASTPAKNEAEKKEKSLLQKIISGMDLNRPAEEK